MAAKKKKEKKESSNDEEKKETKEESSEEKDTVTISKDEWQNLQKQMGQFSDYVNRTDEFVRGASVVVDTMASNPELRQSFQSELRQRYPDMVGEGEESGQQQRKTQQKEYDSSDGEGQTSDVSRKVSDVEASQRDAVVRDFEKDYGINKLPKEEQTEARRKIESYLNNFGLSVKNNPLSNLRGNLERAYLGTHAEKLKEEGKLEGIVQATANNQATMGTISGTAPDSGSDSEVKLTDAQRKWAEKLGVDPEKAEEAYKKRDEEYKRTSKAEQKE